MKLHLGAGTAIIDVDGELDLDAAATAQGMLNRALAAQPRLLVFDLRDMTSIDSAGLALFVRANRRMRNIDGTVVVANATAKVRTLLERVGLDLGIRLERELLDENQVLALH